MERIILERNAGLGQMGTELWAMVWPPDDDAPVGTRSVVCTQTMLDRDDTIIIRIVTPDIEGGLCEFGYSYHERERVTADLELIVIAVAAMHLAKQAPIHPREFAYQLEQYKTNADRGLLGAL